MRNQQRIWTGIFASCGMLLLILDAQTALAGAKEGISLCLSAVIPALFPFFILSSFIRGSLTGSSVPFFRPIGRLCRIPEGSEPLLILGLVGGYPVGAQSVAEACRSGQISKETALRMLGFCSNAGPAFIFGMCSSLFSHRWVPWCIWFIHIISALLAGVMLPGRSDSMAGLTPSSPVSMTKAVETGIKTMASVCGWVMIFRVVIAFCNRWFLWLLPKEMQILLIGILELTNGCTQLFTLPDEGVRFLLCASMLSLGGLCVTMQTASVTKGLGMGMYFPGKALQCLFSILLSLPIATYLSYGTISIQVVFTTALIFTIAFILKRFLQSKKVVAFP